MVIDGHVQARLLGLRLLELEAHVVVGNATPARPRPGIVLGGATTQVPRSERRALPGRPQPATELGRPANADGRDPLPLATAQRLLAEGSTVLAATRRMR
jgi:hypothetical protein